METGGYGPLKEIALQIQSTESAECALFVTTNKETSTLLLALRKSAVLPERDIFIVESFPLLRCDAKRACVSFDSPSSSTRLPRRTLPVAPFREVRGFSLRVAAKHRVRT